MSEQADNFERINNDIGLYLFTSGVGLWPITDSNKKGRFLLFGPIKNHLPGYPWSGWKAMHA